MEPLPVSTNVWAIPLRQAAVPVTVPAGATRMRWVAHLDTWVLQHPTELAELPWGHDRDGGISARLIANQPEVRTVEPGARISFVVAEDPLPGSTDAGLATLEWFP